MKLLRMGPIGRERPCMLDPEGRARLLDGIVSDIGGDALSDAGLDRLRAIDPRSLPLVPEGTRIGPCVAGTTKIICIGLNYADHAAESGMQVPPEPVLFMKAVSSIAGPDDDVPIPPGAEKVDWEVELGVVIGRRCKRVAEADALDYVAGYCVTNDLSERAWQLERQGNWSKGKSHDGFAPLGPWLVTKDEVPDPQNLRLWLDVDDRRFQDGSTRTMVYGVRTLVAYISNFMTLLPGDVISTGTPPGVGFGQKPQVYLRAGQRMALGIDGLGVQHQRTVNDT